MFSVPKASKKKLFAPLLDIPGAFPHASSISLEETRVVEKYLEKDMLEHHIFFNDKKLHNHLNHMLLANYSLGASVQRLHDIFAIEKEKQRPIPKRHEGFKWTEHLGDQDYYADYLDFMTEEVDKLGSVAAIEKYAFDEEHHMLSRWLGGVYHPFIHTGYGIEFGTDGIVAQGLAQLCVHEDSSNVIVQIGDTYKLPATKSEETALEIAMQTRNDSRLKDVLTFEDSPKYKVLLERRPDLVKEYVDKWTVPATSEGLMQKARELMVLAVAFYAGPQRTTKEVALDFFTMHTLTSTLFLPSMIKVLDPVLAAKLLKGKFAVDVAYYISRNRPELNFEQFSDSTRFTKTWKESIDLGISINDEHVPKVIRALKLVERHDPQESLGKGAYRAIASMTVETIPSEEEEAKDGQRWWTQDGNGFEEFWVKIPDRK